MLDFLISIVNYIGTGNSLTIFIFILSSLLAFYFYYQTFYRLVYSTQGICLTCKELGEWSKKENFFRTRILFYNNGRKTLTKQENKNLEIKSLNGDIQSARVLQDKKLILQVSKNKINIKYDYLDAKDFFIIEVEHYGSLNVEGRVSETGKILHREPKGWIIINVLFFLLLVCLLYYSFYEFMFTENIMEKLPIGLNFIIIFLIIRILRFIHSLFFIPDNISNKYLNVKNKLQNEFKHNF